MPGVGPVRTGVTAIWPHRGDLFRDKVAAWVHRINGFGEVTNAEQVREMGVIETPILLTGTQNVPRVADAALDWAFARDPDLGVTTWGPSPLVAECSDQYLSDVRGRHVHSRARGGGARRRGAAGRWPKAAWAAARAWAAASSKAASAPARACCRTRRAATRWACW